MPPWEQLLGPLGLTAGAIVVVSVLWKLVREYIDDIKAAREVWRTRFHDSDKRLDEQTDKLGILPAIATAIQGNSERLDRIERMLERKR